MANHLCSPCGESFGSEQEYLSHKCNKAGGANPKTIDFLVKTTTPHFKKISEVAQQRGEVKNK